MIYADHINHTALYGFHPDFIRQQNDVTPIHNEDLKDEYEFDRSDSKLAGILFAMILMLLLWITLSPLISKF